MSNHDAFLQTIFEQPDDDTPRLVYADWLEENGCDALAEFIRVQIELSALGHVTANTMIIARRDEELQKIAAQNPRLGALVKREIELWEKRLAWRRLPPKWIEQYIGDYRRGLLESWRGKAIEFLKYGLELWEYGPVRALNLRGKDVDFEMVANNPLLDRIEKIVVYPNSVFVNGGIALARSAFSKHLKEVRVLLFGKRIGDQAVRELDARFGNAFELVR